MRNKAAVLLLFCAVALCGCGGTVVDRRQASGISPDMLERQLNTLTINGEWDSLFRITYPLVFGDVHDTAAMVCAALYNAQYYLYRENLDSVLYYQSIASGNLSSIEGTRLEGMYYAQEVLVVAVNEEGLFVSDVATDEFRTDGLFSDNVIEVEITDITPDGASYSISTTNDDPYVMYYIQASMWEDWSDEDIIRNLIEYYDVEENNVYRGDKSGTIIGLMTKTKYVMYTFGCESGTATTSLGKTFFTPESGSSDVTFTLKFDKYFNGDDLIAAYPEEESYKQYAGKAVLPVKAEVSDPSATYLYYVYSVDYSEYGDDVLYSSLLNGTGLSEPSYVFSRNFGRVCTVAGFAIDRFSGQA